MNRIVRRVSTGVFGVVAALALAACDVRASGQPMTAGNFTLQMPRFSSASQPAPETAVRTLLAGDKASPIEALDRAAVPDNAVDAAMQAGACSGK